MDIKNNEFSMDVEVLFDDSVNFDPSLSSCCCCCTAATSEGSEE